MVNEDTTSFKRNGSHGRTCRHLEMKQNFFPSSSLATEYFYLVASGSDQFLNQWPTRILCIDKFF
ncbi:hypothetical protein KSZ_24090 [Dictyobacter formicarum]|uniref:Uncharacterized protein n=1 Tax=Dictyobacter formicarum TaxID=2778368 RepID=A0ABQ3VF08_9CHLR|nr:hypothetical protein KSZ_24090 [Dictyobacter formicarum]